MARVDFSGDGTRAGYLPPWEIAKAYAFHQVILHMETELDMKAREFLGQAMDAYIATHVTLKGGGSPSVRAIRALVKKCEDPAW